MARGPGGPASPPGRSARSRPPTILGMFTERGGTMTTLRNFLLAEREELDREPGVIDEKAQQGVDAHGDEDADRPVAARPAVPVRLW
ncbi:MAG: hypothetical protein M0C28_38525 [Candidatus Moduliflexus flocculans]|nr:hypothetical protein [Candidatus Moduliflexus flocculans]